MAVQGRTLSRPQSTSRQSRWAAVAAAAVLVTAMVAPAAAGAVEAAGAVPSATKLVDETVQRVEDVVEETTGDVRDVTDPVTSSSPVTDTSATSSGAISETIDPSSDDSSSTTQPAGSAPTASSESTTLSVRLGELDIVTVGETAAEADGDGASGDATVLSLLGHEIVGSHSDTDGGDSAATTGLVATAVCGASEGSLCVSLLYGYASSSDDGTTSSGEAYTNLAGACVGGDQNAPHEDCDGPVDVTVGESHSTATAGGTDAAQRSSTVADACVGGREDGVCEGIGATLLQADSADGGPESTQGLVLEAGGERSELLEHPGAIAGACGTDDLCIDANDGATALNPADGPSGDAGDGTPGSDGWAAASADGGVLSVSVGGQDIIGASATGAQADSEGSTSSDATVLSLLGHEVIGAHSSADDGTSEAETGYLTETCTVSGGSLCVALLYGHAESTDGPTSSTSDADTALASACIGGDQADPTDTCDDGVNAEVASSHSDAEQSNGSASSNQVTDGALVCVGGEDADGTCDGFGAAVLHGESHSSAGPDGSAGTSDTSLVTVDVQGDQVVAVDQGDLPLPAECPEPQSVICITLNDRDTDAGASGNGDDSDGGTAIDIEVVPGLLDGEVAADGDAASVTTDATAGQSDDGDVLTSTVDRNPAGEVDRDRTPQPGIDLASGTKVPAADGAVTNDGSSDRSLAQTGLHLMVWLLLGALLIALGVTAVRRSRKA